jgi:hypothetical protein
MRGVLVLAGIALPIDDSLQTSDNGRPFGPGTQTGS